MLTVHHLSVSQSERIVWLLEELEVPYQLVRYERDPATKLAPREYKALHPFGTAPVIDDGDKRLGESGAIIEYLMQTYGNGRLAVPPGAANYTDYLFWSHFANASMLPAAMMSGFASRPGSEEDPFAGFLRRRMERAYRMIEVRLKDVPYFAGDEMTAADIFMLFPLTTMRRYGPRDLSGNPAIQDYLKRIGARPAYQRAMSKAEPKLAPLLE